MGDFPHYFDIILFAMVAAFLVLRLRSVLGRRTGKERRRNNPFAAASRAAARSRSCRQGRAARSRALPRRRRPTSDAPADAVAAGLASIHSADPEIRSARISRRSARRLRDDRRRLCRRRQDAAAAAAERRGLPPILCRDRRAQRRARNAGDADPADRSSSDIVEAGLAGRIGAGHRQVRLGPDQCDARA